MKKILSILWIIWLILLNIYAFRYMYNKSENNANIYINDQKRLVEIAKTSEEQMSWLMTRSQMDEDKWMLFVRKDDKIRNFWMKNTMIPLDIIYIDSWLNILNIQNGLPYNLSPLSSSWLARYVLELNAWQTTKYNIKIGDKIEIK